MAFACCTATSLNKQVKQMEDSSTSNSLTKSLSTICEFLDDRIGNKSSINFVKQAVSMAIAEELKSLVHTAAEDIRSNREAEIYQLKKTLTQKESQIHDLEQIIMELQSFYRAKADQIPRFDAKERAHASSQDDDADEEFPTHHDEAHNLAQKKTFLSRFFRAKLTAQKSSEMNHESSSPVNINNCA
eukprot:gene22799-31096_t